MNRLTSELNPGPVSVWVLLLGLLLGSVPMDGVEARDRGNPWATPEQRLPVPGLRPSTDGRFAPRDYDPVDERRRGRSFGPGEFVQPGYGDASRYPSTGGNRAVPDSLGRRMPDLQDYGTAPWSSGFHGVPGLSYPGISPYSSYLGSGMLFPGTGLTTPGLLSPLYGSSSSGIPMFGVPY